MTTPIAKIPSTAWRAVPARVRAIRVQRVRPQPGAVGHRL